MLKLREMVHFLVKIDIFEVSSLDSYKIVPDDRYLKSGCKWVLDFYEKFLLYQKWRK